MGTPSVCSQLRQSVGNLEAHYLHLQAEVGGGGRQSHGTEPLICEVCTLSR